MTQHRISPHVRHDIALHCLDEEGRPLSFMATFGYGAADPFAVWITFHLPAGEMDWAVDRDLLRKGMHEPAGYGDVQLFPTLDEDGRAMVCFDFHSPEGRLLAQARTADLASFLELSHALVPLGEESAQLDVDLDVDRLLAQR